MIPLRILYFLSPIIKWYDKGIKEEKADGIPLYVRLLAATIPLSKYEYEENLSNGEVEKFRYVESCRHKHKFNDQVVGSRDGYDMIWRHIADDYFKNISKVHERTC